jgi:tape measure domain-containing protein
VATTLGEAVVRFTSQYAGFNEGVQAVTRGMNQVAASMKQAQALSSETSVAMNTFGGAVNGAWQKLRSDLHMEADKSPGIFSRMTGGIQSTIEGLGHFVTNAGFAIYGMQQLGQSAVGLVTAFFGSSAAMEQTRQGFIALLGSSQAADAMLKQLQQFAATTPFEFPQLAEDTRLMLGMGFAARDVIPIMRSVGDAASAVGAGQDGIQRIIVALGQMSAHGKVSQQDMMQLTSLGIPAWKILADAMGISVQQAMDLSQRGLIPADAAVKQLTDGFEKLYKGQMSGQMNTWIGQWSNFQDTAGQTLRTLASPILKVFEGWLANIVTMMGNPALDKFATSLGTNIANSLTRVGAQLPGIIKFFQDFFTTIGLIFSQLSRAGVFTNLQNILSGLGQILSNVINTALLLFGVNLSNAQGRAAGAASSVGGFVSTMQILSTVALGVVNTIKFLTAQFADGGIKGELFRSALIAVIGAMTIFRAIQIAQAIGAFVVALIPAIVEMWGFAAAAYAAAVPMFILELPIWVVVAAVIALIAIVIGVIAVIRNWGAVVAWLQGVWSNVAGFFVAVWGGIASFFIGVWNTIVSFLVGVWARITGGIVAGLGGAQAILIGIVSGIAGAFRAGWAFLVGIVQGAVSAIVGWFIWLYTHNYYFANLVNFIVGLFTNLRSIAISIWSGIMGALSSIWGTISSVAISVWSGISNFLSGVWRTIQGIIQVAMVVVLAVITGGWSLILGVVISHGSQIMSYLSGVWASIQSGVSSAWNAIVLVFSGAWGRVSSVLSSWGANVRNFFAGIASGAYQWGANIINGIVNGIRSVMGNLAGIVNDAAGTISKILGFHSPPQIGPAKDADKWMPNMMTMFTKGIQSEVPRFQSALTSAIQPPRPMLNTLPNARPALPNATSGQTIILQVDGRDLARAVGSGMADEIRLKLGVY